MNTQRTLLLYISGFILSVLLTLAAYIIVEQHVRSDHELYGHQALIIAVSLIALVQMVFQLFFFLHIGGESKPRLKSLTFITTLIGIVILFFGSIWIMYHLNYNHMNQHETETFIIHDEGIGH
jgi:cytochrome o ubiquinol oxidase operon protein cyoD